MALADIIASKKLELAREYKYVKRKLDATASIDTIGGKEKGELELELFDLWDTQNAGHLSFRQLADGIARCTELVESVSLRDVINFNADPNHRIDRAEFGHLLETLVERADIKGNFKDWVLMLTLAWRPSKPAAYVQRQDSLEESAIFQATEDGRMKNLFALFDMDLDGNVSFRDVALGLRKIAPHVSLKKTSEAAMKVLLQFDANHDRSLDYSEFVHFVCAFLHAGNLDFSQVADALVLAAARPDPSEEELAELERVVNSKEFANFNDFRMHQIFDLLDPDHDGYISFKELCLGLHRFEPTKPISGTAAHAAKLLEEIHLSFSEDDPESNKLIDRSEFADVLTRFVEESGADFHQVADYLVAVAASAADDAAAHMQTGWFFNRVTPGAPPAAANKSVTRIVSVHSELGLQVEES